MQTYWSALGLSGTPASMAVEDAAKFVQWASYALQQGASANEAKIRYNLDAFWKAKAAAWGTQTAEGQAQLEKLDTMAHGIWNALESGKIFSASPSYGEFWLKNMLGGVPNRPESAAAAAAAKQAAIAASSTAARSSQPAMATYYQRAAANVSRDQQQAAGMWKQEGRDILGIPLWAWLVGGSLLAITLLMRD